MSRLPNNGGKVNRSLAPTPTPVGPLGSLSNALQDTTDNTADGRANASINGNGGFAVTKAETLAMLHAVNECKPEAIALLQRLIEIDEEMQAFGWRKLSHVCVYAMETLEELT